MSNINENKVKLVFCTERYVRKFNTYNLPLPQRDFTASPLEAIKICEEDSTRFPIVILYKEEVAGFFVLHGWEGVRVYSNNQDAILIRAFSIDSSFQGKGIAQSSMQRVDSFVKEHFPEKNEIILAVNHENTIAQHVYKKCGFEDKGIRIVGRKGEQFVYHKSIN